MSTVTQTIATSASAQRTGGGDRVARFLRDYYIYFVLVAVVVLLSVANLDKFDLFERR